jgi:hypothetical protein
MLCVYCRVVGYRAVIGGMAGAFLPEMTFCDEKGRPLKERALADVDAQPNRGHTPGPLVVDDGRGRNREDFQGKRIPMDREWLCNLVMHDDERMRRQRKRGTGRQLYVEYSENISDLGKLTVK